MGGEGVGHETDFPVWAISHLASAVSKHLGGCCALDLQGTRTTRSSEANGRLFHEFTHWILNTGTAEKRCKVETLLPSGIHGFGALSSDVLVLGDVHEGELPTQARHPSGQRLLPSTLHKFRGEL